MSYKGILLICGLNFIFPLMENIGYLKVKLEIFFLNKKLNVCDLFNTPSIKEFS